MRVVVQFRDMVLFFLLFFHLDIQISRIPSDTFCFFHYQSKCALSFFWIPQTYARDNVQFYENHQESYFDRPDILQLDAEVAAYDAFYDFHESNLAMSRLVPWELVKAAHFNFIASILEMYPQFEIYFLARDAEYLYDVARLVTENTPDASRLHLINISRQNVRDPLMPEYLEQNGISEQTLINGKKVLLVDTGFQGTIPKHISGFFSYEAQKNIKTQLILSDNQNFPSARVFMIQLNSRSNTEEPHALRGTLVNYELLAHFSKISLGFEKDSQGRIHPISAPVYSSEKEDFLIGKKLSLIYMKDLKAYWQQDFVRENYWFEKNHVHNLISLFSTDPLQSIFHIRSVFSRISGFSKTEFEALIRDFIDSQENTNIKVPFNLDEVESLKLGEDFFQICFQLF